MKETNLYNAKIDKEAYLIHFNYELSDDPVSGLQDDPIFETIVSDYH